MLGLTAQALNSFVPESARIRNPEQGPGSPPEDNSRVLTGLLLPLKLEITEIQ